MKTFLKVSLIVIVCLIVASALFSLLGAVLNITFGVIGNLFSFIWRVIFSPAILIVFVVWIIVKFKKKPKS